MKKSSMKGAVLLMLGCVVGGCAAASCNETTEETEELGSGGASGAASTEATAEPSASASSAPAMPAVVALAKEKLDGKTPEPGRVGQTLAVTSAKVDFEVVKAWTIGSADEVEKATDDEARFGASAGGDVLAALELTDCTWGADEGIRLGKDELPTQVADGVCMQGKAAYRAIRAKIDVDGTEVVAIGGWKDGSEKDQVLETFRSAAKMRSVRACCSALTKSAVSAPANQKLIYTAAAAVCQAFVNTKDGREALRQIRGKLPGVTIPASCM
jgi:hypothetical protein